MRYKLLGNNTAVMLTRQPKVIYDTLEITFVGAPQNATVIMESNGNPFYRKLKNGKCEFPVEKLTGTLKVTVAVLDGSTPTKRWLCEELKAEKTKDDGIVICPNDLNLPQTIADLRIEIQHIREENATIREELLEIKKRIVEIMESYDFA